MREMSSSSCLELLPTRTGHFKFRKVQDEGEKRRRENSSCHRDKSRSGAQGRGIAKYKIRPKEENCEACQNHPIPEDYGDPPVKINFRGEAVNKKLCQGRVSGEATTRRSPGTADV